MQFYLVLAAVFALTLLSGGTAALLVSLPGQTAARKLVAERLAAAAVIGVAALAGLLTSTSGLSSP